MNHHKDQDKKNPNAVALGHLGGSKGGKARARNMTPQQRTAVARKAGLARWGKKERMPMIRIMEPDYEDLFRLQGRILHDIDELILCFKALLPVEAFILDVDQVRLWQLDYCRQLLRLLDEFVSERYSFMLDCEMDVL